MPRKITYKPVSKELESIVKPTQNASTRVSVGLDQAVGEYYFIDINKLKPHKNQARKVFDPIKIEELAESIKAYGIRQPLTVLKNEAGYYEVISGERRLRAAKLIKIEKVPCIILKEEGNADAIALIENIHRKDLHPIELGDSYNQLISSNFYSSQEELSKAISVTKSNISEYIKLSLLPEKIKEQIIKKDITSRDKLRIIAKAYDEGNNSKIESLIGKTSRQQKNFSILRILSSEGNIKVQNSGINKLSRDKKEAVKEELLNIVSTIDNQI